MNWKISFYTILALTVSLLSQTSGSFQWVQSSVNSFYDRGSDIVLDNNNNLFVTGIFYESSRFGGYTVNSVARGDMFITKMNTDGDFQWVKTAGGPDYSGWGDDDSNAIECDEQGNIYIGGSFSNTCTFDNITLRSGGDSDIFFAKVDPDGKFLWAQKLGGGGYEFADDLTIDSQGDLVAVGETRSNLAVGSDWLSVKGESDLFILKFDQDGNYKWGTNCGSRGYDDIGSVAVDHDDNIYVTATTSQRGEFGSLRVDLAGPRDVFIIKLDSDGNYLWAKNIGAQGVYMEAGAIHVEGERVYITGAFEDNVNFGAMTLTSAGDDDVFIACMDLDGGFLWANRGGGIETDQGVDLCGDGNGNFYLTGKFKETADFGDLSFTDEGSYDIFVVKFDSTGQFLEGNKAGYWMSDTPDAITCDDEGYAYITGGYAGTVRFGWEFFSGNGLSNFFAAQIFFKPEGLLKSEFTADKTVGAKPLSVRFSNQSIGEYTSSYWDFGDGNTSTSQNPSHTYEEAGKYTVSLTISGNGRSDEEVKKDFVKVREFDTLPIPEISEAPVIDGVWEDAWDSSVYSPIESYLQSPFSTTPEDLSAHLYAAWDKHYLYFWINVNDDVLGLSHANPWENDSIELYFDGDNSKNQEWQGYDANDDQVRFVYGLDPTSTESHINVEEFNHAYAETDSGWLLEVAIPITELHFNPMHNHQFGFEVQINDNDGANREGLLKWWADNDNAWKNPSVFGTAQLKAAAPIANFSADYTQGVAPFSVQFFDKSTGEIDSWLWDFGDGESSTIQNPGHIYANGGTYSVSLTITGPGGSNKKTIENYINVSEAAPVANFVSNVTSGSVPCEINFTDKTTGKVTQWTWDFGDGTTSSEKNPTHTFYSEGIFTVSLYVVGPGGEDSITKEAFITVLESAPVADFQSDVAEGTSPLVVQFTDKSSGNISKWLWNFGDGTISEEQNPVHTFTAVDSFSVSLTVNGPGGMDTKIIKNYIVVNYPAAIAENGAKPIHFILHQNYPNPFNPSTIIKYSVKESVPVHLAIYNARGQLLLTLVDAFQQAGVYSVNFNGDFLPSGMYFYKIQMGSFSDSKKLVKIE